MLEQNRGRQSHARVTLAAGLVCSAVVSVLGAGQASAVDETGMIATIAGMGTSGYSGDGGPADQALLNRPAGVAVDPRGNTYVADTRNARIRKISATGTITTIAGTGIAQASGDGGPALAASLRWPTDLTLDRAGNLYVIDAATVRKIDTAGVITTIAGRTDCGAPGKDGQPATLTFLSDPVALAVDEVGDVLIADEGISEIREVTRDGIIHTLAGIGKAGYGGDSGPARRAQLSHPSGVAVDSQGRVWIADTSNSRIRRIDNDGTISTVVGDGFYGNSGDLGQADAAELGNPTAIEFDGDGNLYVVDHAFNVIRRVDTRNIIDRLAGQTGPGSDSGDGGPAEEAAFRALSRIALDAQGNLYITDPSASRVRRVTPFTTTVHL